MVRPITMTPELVRAIFTGRLREVDARRISAQSGIPVYYLMRRAGRWGRSPAVAVIYAATLEPFHVLLQAHLNRELRRAGFSPDPYCPEVDFDYGEHQRLRALMLAEVRRFAAVIMVVPMVTEMEHVCDLFAYCARQDEVPFILVDQYRRPYWGEAPRNVSFISGDDVEGARRASDIALALPNVKNVLAVAEPGKAVRAECFADFVRGALGREVRVDVMYDAGRTWTSAAEAVEAWCRKAFKAGRPYDTIFGISDWIMQGSLYATDELYSARGYEKPRPVSFDGLDDMRHKVRSGIVAGTVVQDLGALARASVDEVVRRLSNARLRARDRVVQPRIWLVADRWATGAQRDGGELEVSPAEAFWNGVSKAWELMELGADETEVARCLADVNRCMVTCWRGGKVSGNV